MSSWFPSNLQDRLNQLIGAEAFTTDSSGTKIHTAALAPLGAPAVVISIIGIMLTFIIAFGAARQSYCYNKFMGSSEIATFFFAILCFFFPHFYYPFYAVFLNPLCNLKINKGVFFGGKGR